MVDRVMGKVVRVDRISPLNSLVFLDSKNGQLHERIAGTGNSVRELQTVVHTNLLFTGV